MNIQHHDLVYTKPITDIKSKKFPMLKFRTLIISFQADFKTWSNSQSKFMPTKHKLHGNEICENDCVTAPLTVKVLQMHQWENNTILSSRHISQAQLKFAP